MRQRLCRICMVWHDVESWPPKCVSIRSSARSDDLPVPNVITDSIEPVQSMADGRYYSSKAALRATYKPSGNPQGESYIEVGNEATKPYTPPQPKIETAGIDAALHKAVARYERGERVTS